MALQTVNNLLFSGQNGSYTSAAIDVRELKLFLLFLTCTEGGSGTAKLQACATETGTYTDVEDSSRDLGTGAVSIGWDVDSQAPYYKIVVTTGGATAGSSGWLCAKQGA